MGNDTDLDTLFQLPPEEFTAARNALAKAACKNGASIKALTRPPVAAWAVNQLYWRDRDRHDALVEAATDMRRTHRAVIEGRQGDLRAAGREHEVAIDSALKAILGLLKDSGTPVTDATKHAILNTLRALPSDAAPGRLTRTLTPGGFEMLAGITPAAPSKQTARTAPAPSPSGQSTASKKPAAGNGEREAARARERAAAEKAIREAEQRARHAEFEAARAAREATRVARRVDTARTAVEEAREALEAAEADLKAAEREAERAAQASEVAEARSVEAQNAQAQLRSRQAP